MPSYQQICTAIHDTLGPLLLVPAGQFNDIQNYNELTEGMQTLPTLQVYLEDFETSADSETDRYTFCQPGDMGPRRWTVMTIRLDMYARHRSQIDEDWELAHVLVNDVQDALEAQCACPFFGLAGIRNIKWAARRVVFELSQSRYTGFRFELTVGIF